ncbi:polyketide synthase [Sphaerisporangium dianthi]|uniref:Beta-ketoacyl synthase N-terminal-like domain-containing protein n=1 Tax=Sphaerisporangium dianthi TaxID=1436120 RepID=A0ABV9CL08_9ACTN
MSEPIAIIGIGCRFPDASGPEELWRLLEQGMDATGEPPPGRSGAEAPHAHTPALFRHPPGRRGGSPGDAHRPPPNTRRPPPDVRRWPPETREAAFTGAGHDEAARLDPLQGLLLMTAWEALEDAGVAPSRIAGSRTAVFLGDSHMSHAWRRYRKAPLRPSVIRDHGGLPARRLSLTFGLRGPAVTLDTACASSLTAVHLACQSLRAGEAGLALAGGVNLRSLAEEDVLFGESLVPALRENSLFAQDGMISLDGKIALDEMIALNSHGADADGSPREDGIGIIVLKSLERALADGDAVRAVILGSAVANDGANDGATGGAASRPAASGMAGLMRTAMCLERGRVPSTPAAGAPRPRTPCDRPRTEVAATAHELPEGTVAGVSGRGSSSVSVHVVLARAPVAVSRPAAAPRRHLFTMSARSPEALARLAQAYLALLERDDAPSIRDLCYSAATRRDHHPCRFAVVVDSADDLKKVLAAFPAAIPSLGPAPSPGPGTSPDSALDTLAARYMRGEESIDWEGAFDAAAVFVRLPLYPWRAAHPWLD